MIRGAVAGIGLAALAAVAPGCRPVASPAPTPAAALALPSRPAVGIQISQPRPAVGEPVEIRVILDGGTDVFSVPFHLTFDPAVLRWDAAKEGPWLRSDGRPTTFLSALSTPGRLVIGVSRLGAVGGLTGGGEICSLRFTAIGAGDARLAFDRGGVVNGRGESVDASFEASPLVVGPAR